MKLVKVTFDFQEINCTVIASGLMQLGVCLICLNVCDIRGTFLSRLV